MILHDVVGLLLAERGVCAEVWGETNAVGNMAESAWASRRAGSADGHRMRPHAVMLAIATTKDVGADELETHFFARPMRLRSCMTQRSYKDATSVEKTHFELRHSQAH